MVVFHDDEYILKLILAILPLLRRNNDVKKFWCEEIVFHVRELPQNCDLANNLSTFVVVSENVLDLLNCYEVASFDAFGLDHLAEGARAYVSEKLILLSDSLPLIS